MRRLMIGIESRYGAKPRKHEIMAFYAGLVASETGVVLRLVGSAIKSTCSAVPPHTAIPAAVELTRQFWMPTRFKTRP